MQIKDIVKVMTLKGYAIFESDKKPLNLNYVGIGTLLELIASMIG